MNQKDNKKLLYIIFIGSLIPIIVFPLNFLTSGFFVLSDILWVIGAWLGLIGFIIILWQYLIGIKSLVRNFTSDIILINKLHKYLGIYGFLLIFLHPSLITVDFLFKGINLLKISIITEYDLHVFLGKIAFGIVTLSWISSYLLRKKISFRFWKKLHLFNYLIIPIVFLHSKDIGTFFQSRTLYYYFVFLTILFGFVILYRVGKASGITKYKYKIKSIIQITSTTIQLDLTPLKKFIIPQNGQFVEIQTPRFGESHPFSICKYDNLTNQLTISIKTLGKFSLSLTKLNLNSLIFIDGAYGIFTFNAYKEESKKIVLIAGGIGITAFISLIKYIEDNPKRFNEIILFYGNKTISDIAYKDYIDEIVKRSNLKVIYVLSKEDNNLYKNGFITIDLLKEHLKDDLSEYKYFICGPLNMMTKLRGDLKLNNVYKNNIYMEEFSL